VIANVVCTGYILFSERRSSTLGPFLTILGKVPIINSLRWIRACRGGCYRGGSLWISEERILITADSGWNVCKIISGVIAEGKRRGKVKKKKKDQ
jgi:hypothetical protein